MITPSIYGRSPGDWQRRRRAQRQPRSKSRSSDRKGMPQADRRHKVSLVLDIRLLSRPIDTALLEAARHAHNITHVVPFSLSHDAGHAISIHPTLPAPSYVIYPLPSTIPVPLSRRANSASSV